MVSRCCRNIKERIENNTNIDYDGSQTFWKNMLREWTKERENWRRENAKFGKLYVYVCRVQQREGIIEDLIAQHDFWNGWFFLSFYPPFDLIKINDRISKSVQKYSMYVPSALYRRENFIVWKKYTDILPFITALFTILLCNEGEKVYIGR